MEQSRDAGAEDAKRDLADVRFETPAADAAQRVPVVLDEESGARPAVGRAFDANDRRQRRATPGRDECENALDDLARFTPMFHESQARWPNSTTCCSARRYSRFRLYVAKTAGAVSSATHE